MTSTRIFIDTANNQYLAITKFHSSNPSVKRDGAKYTESTFKNHGFGSIEDYLLNSYKDSEIIYSEI
jgi:hypothetical protein